MIPDGYTIHGEFDNRRFSYRPALHAERMDVMRGHRSEDMVREFLLRHVVWAEFGWESWFDSDIQALFLICLGITGPQRGGDWEPNWEYRDATNLRDGVILEQNHPQFAARSCEDCLKYWFDDDTGKILSKPDGTKRLRPEGAVALCQTPSGCPKGTPDNQSVLSQKNRMAWKHFQECEAVGQFPDDPIVRRNARIIREALRKAEVRRGR